MLMLYVSGSDSGSRYATRMPSSIGIPLGLLAITGKRLCAHLLQRLLCESLDLKQPLPEKRQDFIDIHTGNYCSIVLS